MYVAIVQARMNSTRLPGKVLLKVNNKPLLAYQLDRMANSKRIDKIIVATSELEVDDIIVDFCIDYGIEVYRGSESDVMGRYHDCAKKYLADVIIRVTADCPLIDPEIIDKVIEKFEQDKVDYCGNTVPPQTSQFPDGSDVEVFTMQALKKAHLEVNDIHFREHVTFQFWQDTQYKISQMRQEKDWSSYRFTVDYPEDFEVMRYLLNQIRSKKIFGSLQELIDIIDKNPDIKKKNSHYYFGQGWSN